MTSSRNELEEEDDDFDEDDGEENDEEDDLDDDDDDVRKPETFRDRMARRSPRVQGLFVIGMGLAGVALNVVLIAIAGVYYPFVSAGASGFVGIGLWYILTNHSFLEGDENLPAWWKAGALVSALIGTVFGFFATH